MLTFIELEPFARVREALLDDSELSKLQLHLMTHPEVGDVIPGSEGCRKMRWSWQTGWCTSNLLLAFDVRRDRTGNDVCEKRT